MLLVAENAHYARYNDYEVESKEEVCDEAEDVYIIGSGLLENRVPLVLTVEALYSFSGAHAEILHFALGALKTVKNDSSFTHHGHHFKLGELGFRVDLLTSCLLTLKHKLLIEFTSNFMLDLLLNDLNSIYNFASHLFLLLYPLLFLIHCIIGAAIRLNNLLLSRIRL